MQVIIKHKILVGRRLANQRLRNSFAHTQSCVTSFNSFSNKVNSFLHAPELQLVLFQSQTNKETRKKSSSRGKALIQLLIELRLPDSFPAATIL